MVVLDTDFIIGYLREAPKIIEILRNYEENRTLRNNWILYALMINRNKY
ncbi:MAG: hypothetical protein ACTSO9_21310 [Candidatus Helarchaeota archaeon]